MSLRSKRFNSEITGEINSSFLSCEKDAEMIIEKLFVKSRPYSDELKRLLLINTRDCLDDKTNPAYIQKIQNTSIKQMCDEKYIRFVPKLEMNEHEPVKSYIIISFDHFRPTSNPQYRDCIVEIDIICHPEFWDLGNFRQRPLKIAGYIDGILNRTKMSGIGTLEYISCDEIVLNENLMGYCLKYTATHGVDDILPIEEEEE